MNLEDQVCSLELSRKLLTLGVKQKSLFYWVGVENSKKDMVVFSIAYLSSMFKQTEKDKYKEIYSAFTVAELGEILPINLNSYKLDTGKWYCEAHECHGAETNWEYTEDETEANARAKMLIYLLENKLLTLEK